MKIISTTLIILSLILSLYFTISIVCRVYVIGLSVKSGNPSNTKPITTIQFLMWAMATGIFITLQFLVK